MKKVKSSGAVIFKKDKEIKYLLLQYGLGHWDFPRGLVEKDETEEQAALREIKEETGIKDVKILPNFKEKVSFFFRDKGELINKEVIYFLAKTETEKIKLSYEHLKYEWLNYEDASNRLTFNNVKNILKKADKILNSSLLKFNLS